MSQEDINRQILEELKLIKKGLPNGELKRMDANFKEIKNDVSELKELLMNPKNGLIVETNKNTDFRKDRESRLPFYEQQIHELDKLKDWKSGVTKALWILYSATFAIIIKFISEAIK